MANATRLNAASLADITLWMGDRQSGLQSAVDRFDYRASRKTSSSQAWEVPAFRTAIRCITLTNSTTATGSREQVAITAQSEIVGGTVWSTFCKIGR